MNKKNKSAFFIALVIVIVLTFIAILIGYYFSDRFKDKGHAKIESEVVT